jgi:hypothetical protein
MARSDCLRAIRHGRGKVTGASAVQAGGPIAIPTIELGERPRRRALYLE